MTWSMKVLLLLLLLAFGVFLGIDTADKAVKQLTGAEEQSSTPSYYVSRIDNGKMVVVPAGGKEQTEPISVQKESTVQPEAPLKAAAKTTEKEEIVKPSANGYLSQIGNDLGNKTTALTRSLLEKLLGFLTK